VARIEPVLDAYSHTASVEITIANSDHALLPGMFARVEIVADERSGVPVLPQNAIFKRQGRDYAFVYNEEEGRIFLTELKLGYYDLEKYEVVEGAELDDIVVDRNLVILKDRTGVNISNPKDIGLDLDLEQ
jgi:multidrug efflux pump subunit AcrA (membrane-fusion protein)